MIQRLKALLFQRPTYFSVRQDRRKGGKESFNFIIDGRRTQILVSNGKVIWVIYMERRIHITLHTKPEGKFKQYCTFYTTSAKKNKKVQATQSCPTIPVGSNPNPPR
jgi:hypothetical protein